MIKIKYTSLVCGAILMSSGLNQTIIPVLNNKQILKSSSTVKAEEEWKVPSDALKFGKSNTSPWYISKDNVLHFGGGQIEERWGGAPGLFQNDSNIITKIVFDKPTKMPRNAFELFQNLKALSEIDFTNADFNETVDISDMLENDTSLKSVDFTKIDFSKVEGMGHMLAGCTALETVNMEKMKFSKLIRFDNVFLNDTNLKSVNMPAETPNVQWIAGLFQNCSSLEYIDLSMLDTTKMAADNPADPNSGTHDFITGANNLWEIKTGDKFKKKFNLPSPNGFKWGYVGTGTLDNPEITGLTSYDGTKPGVYVQIDPNMTTVNATFNSNLGDVLVPIRGKIGTDAKGTAQIKDSAFTTDEGQTPERFAHIDDKVNYTIKDKDTYHDGKLTVDNNGIVNDKALLGQGNKIFYWPIDGTKDGGRSTNILNGAIFKDLNYIDPDGNWKSGKGDFGIEYVAIPEGHTTAMLKLAKGLQYVDTNKTYFAWYDKDKKFIKRDLIIDKDVKPDVEYSRTIPKGAKYFRTSFPLSIATQTNVSEKVDLYFKKDIETIHGFMGTAPYYVDKDGTLVVLEGTINKDDLRDIVDNYNDKIFAIDFSKANGKVYLPENIGDLLNKFTNVKKINLTNLSVEKTKDKRSALPKIELGNAWVKEDNSDFLHEISDVKDGWYFEKIDRTGLLDHDTGKEIAVTPNEQDVRKDGTMSIDFVPNFEFGEQKYNIDGVYNLPKSDDNIVQVTKRFKGKFSLTLDADDSNHGYDNCYFRIESLKLNRFDSNHNKIGDEKDLFPNAYRLLLGTTINVFKDSKELGMYDTDYEVDSLKIGKIQMITPDESNTLGNHKSSLIWTLKSAD